MNPFQLRHTELIAKANAIIVKIKNDVKKDPTRPTYHLMPAANWMNDPNGPIFYKGNYHIFFQHNPYDSKWGNISWGHAKSKDLVYWEHCPIALTPNPESYDKDGVFSGCCVVHDDVPTIIYTGVYPEVQCMAKSFDNLNTWIKYEGNPVISAPPLKKVEGFRDPYIWKEDDYWYMLIGSGIKGKGGTAFLYQSNDLINWRYLHPLCMGFGKMWECPNFFPLDDKYILIVSPFDDVQYSIGKYENQKFLAGNWNKLDHGGCKNFYAPNTLINENGRRILWGWISGGGTKGYPWNGCLTLPRVLSLFDDKSLSIKPHPELKKLRGKHTQFKRFKQTPFSSNILNDIEGDCLEILLEIEKGSAKSFGLMVRCSADDKEGTSIVFYSESMAVTVGDKKCNVEILQDEKILILHIFLDKSVMEVFINNRISITSRIFPNNENNMGLNFFSEAGSLEVISLDIWEINSIWI